MSDPTPDRVDDWQAADGAAEDSVVQDEAVVISVVSEKPERRGSRTIRSVDRALDVLEALAGADRPLHLNQVAMRAGLNVSTCHHMLATLEQRGYVDREKHDRTYFLGSKVFELSSSRVRQISVIEEAMPELRRLNEVTRESVHLAVMQGTRLATIAKLDSNQAIRVGTDGMRKDGAAHATATGKAILAWLPENEIAAVIADHGLPTFTQKTLVTIGDLLEDLRHVRRNGYAVDDEEFQPGVKCVGAAIRDHTGAVIASISCSMPVVRATDEQFDFVKSAVLESAKSLSSKLGGDKTRT